MEGGPTTQNPDNPALAQAGVGKPKIKEKIQKPEIETKESHFEL